MMAARLSHAAGRRPLHSGRVIELRSGKARGSIGRPTGHQHLTVRKQSRGEGETASRHAARDGPLALSWVKKLSAGEVCTIKAQPAGDQHFSVGQKRGCVVVTRGVEAAGKRE